VAEVAPPGPEGPRSWDPLAGSTWGDPATVAGFSQASPNAALLRYADAALPKKGGRALDLGCGAGRNALPLAARGWTVLGLDLSWPMLLAGAERARSEGLAARVRWALAPMEHLPVRDDSFDLVVAHGIWNLAPSTTVFRQAVAEAARVARPGAALFLFTFSRNTLPPDAEALPGEPFVFTQFSGQPQRFLTQDELRAELGRVGFEPDPSFPLTEHNRPPVGVRRVGGPPVIWEWAFRRR